MIQPAAVNEAFAGEAIYWAKPIDEVLMKKMLKNSLCLGLYELPDSSSAIAGDRPILLQFTQVVVLLDLSDFQQDEVILDRLVLLD